jgi:hypothetical protein
MRQNAIHAPIKTEADGARHSNTSNKHMAKSLNTTINLAHIMEGSKGNRLGPSMNGHRNSSTTAAGSAAKTNKASINGAAGLQTTTDEHDPLEPFFDNQDGQVAGASGLNIPTIAQIINGQRNSNTPFKGRRKQPQQSPHILGS